MLRYHPLFIGARRILGREEASKVPQQPEAAAIARCDTK